MVCEWAMSYWSKSRGHLEAVASWVSIVLQAKRIRMLKYNRTYKYSSSHVLDDQGPPSIPAFAFQLREKGERENGLSPGQGSDCRSDGPSLICGSNRQGHSVQGPVGSELKKREEDPCSTPPS